jgi:putative ATP-dependent endonuclease of the OLD family
MSVQIRRLKIKRYRGIREFMWCPDPGVNCLIGPGDVGKTTILEAIATVLSAAPGRVASEHDYFDGVVGEGYAIEVLLGDLDDELLGAWPAAPLWTWWADRHTVQADPDPEGEGVLCVRACGSPDLEIEHLVIDPSEGATSLSPSKRQLFGLSTIGSAAGAYRDLRMSRGSLLYRNVEHDQLRGLITDAVQATRDTFTPGEDVEKRLDMLSHALEEIAPGNRHLSLAMLSPRGQSLLGMIGLFEKRENPVPLANAGLGTQKLALFVLARMLAVGSPLFVLDEVESGLEPFRQRDLIVRIRETIGTHGQAFMTTHSPAVVGEMALSELARIDPPVDGALQVRPLPQDLERTLRRDPEALLSRLMVVVEGQTEFGLLEVLLRHHAQLVGMSLGALGLRLLDGNGQPEVFKLTDALRATHRQFAAFLDSEHEHSGKREALAAAEHVAFATYTGARCLEEALARQLTPSELDVLIAAGGSDAPARKIARLQQLNQDAGVQSRKTIAELAAEEGEEQARSLFSKVANSRKWFKTRADAATVAEHLLEHHPTVQIVRDAAAFWEAIVDLTRIKQPEESDADDRPGP